MVTRILLATALLASCDASSASNTPADQGAPVDAETPVSADDMTAQTEEEKVLETIQRMTEAFNRGDIDAVMSTYEDPAAVVFAPDQPTASTTEQIRAGFEQFVTMKPNFSFSGHEVYIADDIAVHHTPWKMTATAPDGTAIEHKGLSVAVLRRQSDGEWLMAIDNPSGEIATDVGPGEGDEKSVLETIKRMTTSFRDGDIEGIMSTYAPSAIVLFQPGVVVAGLTELRGAFEASIAMKPKFEFGAHKVVISGDIAVHHNPWTMTASAPDGSTIEQSGLSIAVLQRQADGQWLMVIDNPHGQRLIDTIGYPD